MGSSSENGVIDTNHELFGYKGVYVVDGAAVSANIGVNPSLTISAMAERAMSLIPSKIEAPGDFFEHRIEVKRKNGMTGFFKKIFVAIALLLMVNTTLTGINILQKGGPYDGRSIEQILGKPAKTASVEDIQNLSKHEIMQLFYASPPPEFASMRGEYKAKTLPVGIMAPAADFFTHHFFGPGHWEGKAFLPEKYNLGWGYNLFEVQKREGHPVLSRERKMDTWIAKSLIDERPSFHLVYKAYNGGLVRSMHDEIREINNTLYICMGYMAAGGGSINPAPFVLYGHPSPWVGPDSN